MKYLLIILLILLLFFVLHGQEETIEISWDKYNSSPDAEFIYIYEIDENQGIIEKLGTVSIQDTIFRFNLIPQNKIYYFVITAIDTAGNESEFSNIVSCDYEKPVAPQHLEIRK